MLVFFYDVMRYNTKLNATVTLTFAQPLFTRISIIKENVLNVQRNSYNQGNKLTNSKHNVLIFAQICPYKNKAHKFYYKQ